MDAKIGSNVPISTTKAFTNNGRIRVVSSKTMMTDAGLFSELPDTLNVSIDRLSSTYQQLRGV
jgi:hypothetical protein